MALAANALTTLDTLRAELGLDEDVSKDALLERWINEASAALERHCGRKFQKASVTEKLKGTGTRELLLSRTPIVSITSVTLDEDVLDADDYEIEDAEVGILSRSNGWPADEERCIGIAWTPIPGTGERNIAVAYVGGYVLPNDAGTCTLPPDLERACIETVKSMSAAQLRDPAVSSEQLGDYSVTYRASSGGAGILPEAALALADAHRRIGL